MPSLESITENDLEGLFTPSSLDRAYGYLHRVDRPSRSGDMLCAEVRGTALYHVRVTVKPNAISAICTCPYDWGGYCKHIGAVLLKWIDSPSSFLIQNISDRGKLVLDHVTSPATLTPDYQPFWLATPFASRRQAEKEQLQALLELLRLQDLRAIAARRGWGVRGTRKKDVVQQVAALMMDPAEVRRAVAGLEKGQRHFLNLLLMVGDGTRVSEYVADRTDKRWDPGREFGDDLVNLGLVFPGGLVEGFPPRGDFVPAVVGRHLPPLDASVLAPLDLSEQDANVQLGDPSKFIRRVDQILLLLEQRSMALRAPMPRPRIERMVPGLAGWDYDLSELEQVGGVDHRRFTSDLVLTVPRPAYRLSDEAVEWLAPVAGGADHLDFIYALLVGVGALQPGNPVTVWSEVKTEFLRHDEATQRALLGRTFFWMRNWSVLWWMLAPAGPLLLKRRLGHYRREQFMSDLVGFRQVVLRVLASIPDGQWVAFEELLSLVKLVFPRFDRDVLLPAVYAQGNPSWYLADSDGRQLQPGDDMAWKMAQGRFVQQIIAGPLYLLGLADLCFDGNDLFAVRFQGLADLFWERVQVPLMQSIPQSSETLVPGGAVAAEDDLVRVHASAVGPLAHSFLDQIARLEIVEMDWFMYRLDSRAVFESFEDGITLEKILAEWGQLIPVPMPGPMLSVLTELWEGYGQVQIYRQMTLIEFGDDFALAEMRAISSLDEFLVAEISPRIVAIRPEGVDKLTSELRSAGYTPKRAKGV